MSMNIATPGVYIREINSLPPSVAGVSTAIPAFIGYVEKAERDGLGIPMCTPVRITSMLEYESLFGGAYAQPFSISIADTADTPVTSSSVIETRTITVNQDTADSDFRMYYHLQMYFANGGGPCWIVPVGVYSAITIKKGKLQKGLVALEKISEVTLLVVPDAVSADLSDLDRKAIYEDALAQCEGMKNRFTVMDVPQSATPAPVSDGNTFRNNCVGPDNLNYGAAYYPYLDTTLNYGTNPLLIQVASYTINGGPVTAFDDVRNFNTDVSKALQGTKDALSYLMVATETLSKEDAKAVQSIVTTVNANVTSADSLVGGLSPEFEEAGDIIEAILVDTVGSEGEMVLAVTKVADFVTTTDKANANALKTALQKLLFALETTMTEMTDGYNDPSTEFVGGNLNYLRDNQPSVYTEVMSAIAGYRVMLNPSGTIAGIYARVDTNKGVWSAPANVGVRNVIGPSVRVTNQQQGELNVDALSGKSINVIRNFQGRGTIVWGARTLEGNSNEWRYVNVRRLFIYLEESIKRASERFVFEPNDANTWVNVKAMISNFLTGVWKDGGLTGATAQEAFFVNVGVGTSMTMENVLAGEMIIEVGVAAVRPAEFIILRFTHYIQE